MKESLRINKVKGECHRLMEIIWGKSRAGKTKAYLWLKANTEINHFSEENDYGKLFTARAKLYKLGLKGGQIIEEEIPYIFKT